MTNLTSKIEKILRGQEDPYDGRINVTDAAKEIAALVEAQMEEVAQRLEGEIMKFARDADRETHGSYMIRGSNVAYRDAARIIRSSFTTNPTEKV